jgi:hypothetical protein
MNRGARHLSYSNVMSTVAVFLALGGGSVAIAGVAANNSVDSAAVIDETLKTRDLKDGQAVESSDVVDEELGAADIAAGGIGQSEVGTDAIGTGEIKLNGVASPEIVSGGVGADEIATGAIGPSELGEIYRGDLEEVSFDDDDAARNGDYEIGEVSADCVTRDASGELISADIKWDGPSVSIDEDPEQFISEIKLNMATDTATVVGGTDTGAFSDLQVSAVCLD